MAQLKRIGQRMLSFIGYRYPSRTDRMLEKTAGLISRFYPREIRKRKKIHFKRRIFTFYYGDQVIRTAKSIGKGFYCGGPSCVNRNTVLKDFVSFNGMFINGGGAVTIGSYFHSGVECMIITQSHDYDVGEMIPYGINYSYKEVVIGDFVWFGRRVTVLPGTKIGEGAIIQAGAVVHGEIPPYAIAGGNPAKVFKFRDIDHFQKWKSEGKGYTEDLYCDLLFGPCPK